LFDKNVKATGFNSSFFNCTSLTNRPKPHGLEMWQIEGTNGRPSIMNLIALFKGCTAMPDYTSIPIWIRN
ncbi:hypothetical protein, partial [Capnocytophaga canis]|uniref:hypothetical protein n=1 Tax=Capnocytophaga canis TaxID=1848903 RepID=UPI001BB42764